MTNYATLSGIYGQNAAALQNATALGAGVRRVQDRRLVLRSAGGVQQRRIPARPETVPLARRQSGAHDHHPRRRSRYPGRHFAYRRDQARGGRRPSREHRWRARNIYIGGTAATYKDIQDRRQVRPDDRRHRRAQPDPAHHDVHHPKPGRRAGHRRHRGVVAGRLIRPVGTGLAVHPRHPVVLGHNGTGRHPACWQWVRTTTCC